MKQKIKDTDMSKVRVVFMQKPQKKHPFTIPINKLRHQVFMTGQDLSYRKMTGAEELTSDEVKKYPVVIDPTELYKVTHMQPLDRNNDYDKAIEKLLLLSGRIAESKSVYDKTPVEFLGYIKDDLAESKADNMETDIAFEAEEAVRNSTIDDYKKIALIINYRLGKNNDVNTMPDSYVKAELIKAAKSDPAAVKMCFPKWNAAVAQDIYILQLIKHKILTKKPNGDIFDNGDFIGSGLDAVTQYMRLESHKDSVSKWKTLLDQKLGLVSKQVAERAIEDANSNERNVKYSETLNKLKAALLDENIQGADFHYNVLVEKYKDLFDIDEEANLQSKMTDLRLLLVAKKNQENIAKFKDELDELNLVQLQKKISHNKTPFDEKECKDFWEDRKQLIEYMLNIKFPK